LRLAGHKNNRAEYAKGMGWKADILFSAFRFSFEHLKYNYFTLEANMNFSPELDETDKAAWDNLRTPIRYPPKKGLYDICFHFASV
jgi:hypothetical protein